MGVFEILSQLPERAVIRWTMHQRFTYTALKIGDRWYTSATDANTQVAQIMDTYDLANALTQGLYTFEVAADWKEHT